MLLFCQVTIPSPRMGSGLCVKHGVLYLYGGIVEDGDKQYTLNDMFALGKLWRNQQNNMLIVKGFSRSAQRSRMGRTHSR